MFSHFPRCFAAVSRRGYMFLHQSFQCHVHHFSVSPHFSAVIWLPSSTMWAQPAVDRSWSTGVHRKACPRVPSPRAADCQIAPVPTTHSPLPGEPCWAPLAMDMCEQSGKSCRSVKNGNAQSRNQSSFIHLFWNRNDSEPKIPTSLLVWVQAVQMASVFMMSISGLALGREHLLLGAESLSLAWQEYT